MSKDWNNQHELILKKWGEVAACYSWMHDRAYRQYKVKNMHYAIPVIILSTLTGTANFAQQNIPERYRAEAIMIIGGLNLLSGLITTLAQFFKVNELQEAHRGSSVMFSKFSRYIAVELNLPTNDRSSDGAAFVENCRQEYNRMVEQSPSIPDSILVIFNRKYKNAFFSKPAISRLEEIKIFKDIDTHEDERRKRGERIRFIEHQKTLKNVNKSGMIFKVPSVLRNRGLDDSDSDELNMDARPGEEKVEIELPNVGGSADKPDV